MRGAPRCCATEWYHVGSVAPRITSRLFNQSVPSGRRSVDLNQRAEGSDCYRNSRNDAFEQYGR